MVDELSEITAGISAAVEEQAASTKEVALNTTGVSDAAAEAGKVANNILDAVNSLNDQSRRLNASVDGFVANLST